MSKLFAICPGFGLPETATKEALLRANLAHLRSFAPEALVRICCYSPGYRLPPDIAAGVEAIHERGIVGNFLLRHAHPEELAALRVTHVAILLDDVELLPGIDLALMLEVLAKAGADIASPVMSTDSPVVATWAYMQHDPAQPSGSVLRATTCEMFFLLMPLAAYARYYQGLDLANPWCWGVDLTLNAVRGLQAVLFNDMRMRHWYQGASLAAGAKRDEEAYLRRRGWEKQALLDAQRFERTRYRREG